MKVTISLFMFLLTVVSASILRGIEIDCRNKSFLCYNTEQFYPCVKVGDNKTVVLPELRYCPEGSVCDDDADNECQESISHRTTIPSSDAEILDVKPAITVKPVASNSCDDDITSNLFKGRPVESEVSSTIILPETIIPTDGSNSISHSSVFELPITTQRNYIAEIFTHDTTMTGVTATTTSVYGNSIDTIKSEKEFPAVNITNQYESGLSSTESDVVNYTIESNVIDRSDVNSNNKSTSPGFEVGSNEKFTLTAPENGGSFYDVSVTAAGETTATASVSNYKTGAHPIELSNISSSEKENMVYDIDVVTTLDNENNTSDAMIQILSNVKRNDDSSENYDNSPIEKNPSQTSFSFLNGEKVSNNFGLEDVDHETVDGNKTQNGNLLSNSTESASTELISSLKGHQYYVNISTPEGINSDLNPVLVSKITTTIRVNENVSESGLNDNFGQAIEINNAAEEDRIVTNKPSILVTTVDSSDNFNYSDGKYSNEVVFSELNEIGSDSDMGEKHPSAKDLDFRESSTDFVDKNSNKYNSIIIDHTADRGDETSTDLIETNIPEVERSIINNLSNNYNETEIMKVIGVTSSEVISETASIDSLNEKVELGTSLNNLSQNNDFSSNEIPRAAVLEPYSVVSTDSTIILNENSNITANITTKTELSENKNDFIDAYGFKTIEATPSKPNLIKTELNYEITQLNGNCTHSGDVQVNKSTILSSTDISEDKFQTSVVYNTTVAAENKLSTNLPTSHNEDLVISDGIIMDLESSTKRIDNASKIVFNENITEIPLTIKSFVDDTFTDTPSMSRHNASVTDFGESIDSNESNYLVGDKVERDSSLLITESISIKEYENIGDKTYRTIASNQTSSGTVAPSYVNLLDINNEGNEFTKESASSNTQVPLLDDQSLKVIVKIVISGNRANAFEESNNVTKIGLEDGKEFDIQLTEKIIAEEVKSEIVTESNVENSVRSVGEILLSRTEMPTNNDSLTTTDEPDNSIYIIKANITLNESTVKVSNLSNEAEEETFSLSNIMTDIPVNTIKYNGEDDSIRVREVDTIEESTSKINLITSFNEDDINADTPMRLDTMLVSNYIEETSTPSTSVSSETDVFLEASANLDTIVNISEYHEVDHIPLEIVTTGINTNKDIASLNISQNVTTTKEVQMTSVLSSFKPDEMDYNNVTSNVPPKISWTADNLEKITNLKNEISTKHTSSPFSTNLTEIHASDNDFLCEASGRFPDLKNCSVYHKCIEIAETTFYHMLVVCPQGTLYDVNTQNCTGRPVHCPEDITLVCNSSGVFSHPTDCNRYYKCFWRSMYKKFALWLFKCPPRMRYDSEKKKCVNAALLPQCDGLSEVSVASADVTESPFYCTENGRFPMEYNCDGYYDCKEKKGAFQTKVKTCSQGKLFDRELGRCRKSELVFCPYEYDNFVAGSSKEFLEGD